MYADWLRAYIPRSLTHHTIESTTTRLRAVDVKTQRRPGDPHSRRIRCVCGDCNSGWMSRLQEEVRPYLVPLLIGDSTKLRTRGQTKLAAWAAMTAMSGEFLEKESVAVSARDRKLLRQNGQPPEHWRIWIGQHQRKSHPLWSHNAIALTKEKIERPTEIVPGGHNTQSTTICLGKHLVVHIISSQVGRRLIRKWRFRSDVEAKLEQIWPVRRLVISWPPPSPLLDDDIHYIANQLHDNASTLIRKMAEASS